MSFVGWRGAFCFHFSSFRELLQLTCCSHEPLARRRFWHVGQMRVVAGRMSEWKPVTALAKALGLEWDIECGF